MSGDSLSDFVASTAGTFGVPGVAVAVWAGGREEYACHGVTSVDNRLPIDRDTMFLLGSVSKTYTATALMHLVCEGRVELGAPVRRYVPELRLRDERAVEYITVRNLLNHTAGLDWGLIIDTGEGDAALADYVAAMAGLELVCPPGARASYSQAGYNLAGRIVENVTGLTFERALSSRLFEPLGLRHTFFARDDIMTRRFAVGHNPGADGSPSVARLWRRSRGDNPGGGVVSSLSDLLRWARFHLGHDAEAVVPTGMLPEMQQPTVRIRGSSLGDALGICWFLRNVGGLRAVSHGGSANGQFAELLMVPERDFAVVALSNAAPNGIPFNHAVLRWALQAYLGVADADPEPLPYDEAWARDVAGNYQNEVMTLTITTNGPTLELEARIKAEIRAAGDADMPPDYPPATIGLLPGAQDEYLITDGGLKGQRGYFTRDTHGTVTGVDLAGRMFKRALSA